MIIEIEGVMSEIPNITPAAIPALKSQLFNMAGESSQSVATVAQSAAVSLSGMTVKTSLQEGENESLTAESVKAAADIGNRVLQAVNKNLQFQIDEATNQVVVQIVDNETGEVVRQIPTVEMLDFIRAMKEQESNIGKLYQDKA